MSNIKDIAAFAASALEPILGESGFILYSGAKTIRQCPIYILGHNPGGSPKGQAEATIGAHLNEMPYKETNSYLDEVWTTATGRTWKKGQAPLQKRVIWLLQHLGLNSREVPCSNLMFVRSEDVSGVSSNDLADICWKVHEKILETVSPSLLLVFGNSDPSPYTYLKAKYAPLQEATFPSGHGNWMCRSFRTKETTVIGLPHLSYYKIIDKHDVIQWIKDHNAL